MKRLAYLIALFGLLLTSCTDEDSLSNPPTGNNDKTVFQFSVNMPEYTSVRTRAAINENAVNDLWLMTFDTNGLFIGRVHAECCCHPLLLNKVHEKFLSEPDRKFHP